MSTQIQVRTVTAELLRAGPAHNQLLSPLTQYLGVCDDFEAGIVTVPYEHAAFLRRMGSMRYVRDDSQADREPVLRELGIGIAKSLGAIPRLPGALSADPSGPDTLIHLRLVLSASELAALPFELAKDPISPNECSESWLSLQHRVPVVITRRTRNVTEAGITWPTKPRVLFISADPDRNEVPFDDHRTALLQAVQPFVNSVAPELTKNGRREQFGDVLTILRDASFDEVVSECQQHCYTHVHILAHGVEDDPGEFTRFGVQLRTNFISADRLSSALTGIVDGVKQRPTFVTLATCDSGNVGSVVIPGASIAHVLHQAGIPFVLASQVPLTKEGSTHIVRELYRGLLWAENPWVLLHRIRTELHGRFAARSHDWASLVVYEALPSDLVDQLDEARYYQSTLANKVALRSLGSIQEPGPQFKAGVKRVLDSCESFPLERAFRFECFGLRASTFKQLAEHAFRVAQRAPKDEQPAHVRQSYAYLERALHEYERAAEGYLVLQAEKTVQRVATLHWVLTQQLCLAAVLRRAPQAGSIEIARLSAMKHLTRSDPEQRAWACGSLAELCLLELCFSGAAMGAAERKQLDLKIRGHVRDLIARARQLDRPLIIESTERQLRRYAEWWGASVFVDHYRSFDPGGVENVSAATIGTGESSWKRIGIPELARSIADTLIASIALLPDRPAGEVTAISSTHSDAGNKESRAELPVKVRAQAGKLGTSIPEQKLKRSSVRRDVPTLRVEMLPAFHGDCLWIEYGDGDKLHRVLIDCGTDSTYRNALKSRLERLPKKQREIELFILSHVDDDHIGGGIALLKDAKELGLTFGDVWFNGWRHLAPFANLGAVQGEKFSELILRNAKQGRLAWNAWRNGKSIVVPDEGALPVHQLPGGMRLTVLSPNAEKLATLAQKWKKEVEKAGMDPGDREDARAKLGLLGRGQLTSSTDPKTLAAMKFTSDSTANNGSSIAVLAEYEGKRVIFGADAHAPLLADSIRRLLRPGQRKLMVDALKLPHHGSQNNLNNELVELLDCRDYLVSSNGDRFSHPDRPAIGRVIKFGGERPRIHFNYESKFNRVWKSEALQKKHNYEAVFPNDKVAGLLVQI